MKCFKPGDLAVYPNYGVGKVESIETRSLGQNDINCYVINMISNGSKVFVPVDSAKDMGLRTITEKDSANSVYCCFKHKNQDLLKMNWNKRYRFLQDKMKTGKIDDVASVISNLNYLKKKKGLSYGEDKLLCEAEEIISTELSISEDLSKDEILTKIQNSLNY